MGARIITDDRDHIKSMSDLATLVVTVLMNCFFFSVNRSRNTDFDERLSEGVLQRSWKKNGMNMYEMKEFLPNLREIST